MYLWNVFSICLTNSFVLSPSPQRRIARPSSRRITLDATKRPNKPTGNANSYKIKSSSSNNNSKKKKTQQQPRASSTASTSEPTTKKDSVKKTKSSTPPWQVLSTKEAKENVSKEISRRNQIKEGLVPTHQPTASKNSPREASQVLSKEFLVDADRKLLNWKPFNPDKAIMDMKMVGAYLDDRQLPPRLGVPEVAFLGRSNVGKSSLLNRLTASAVQSSTKARVGKTPGATASVNLYSLYNRKEKDLLGFVDLPGFGFAKLSKDTKAAVEAAAEHYLGKRKELMLGILLVDIRRTPSEDDRAVLAALFDMGVPIAVVATKTDKISSTNEREKQLFEINQQLGLPEGQPLCVSSVTGEGIRDLWRIVLEACEAGVAEKFAQYQEKSAETDDEDDYDDDEEGIGAFEDSEDIVYDQGYDWVHGNYYEDDMEEGEEDGDYVGDDDSYEFEDDDDFFYDSDISNAQNNPPKETLKDLRKRVRDMERRGDV
jgi:GTP-binding protein